MSQDDTTNRKRDSLEEEEVDTGLTDGLRRAKRIKIEQADDEYSDEEEDIIVASKRGRSRPKQRQGCSHTTFITGKPTKFYTAFSFSS